MLNNLKKNKDGFTIIEVLIVLAIAGLILLVVFLAVPALQRQSRNTGRKNDAARVATAVNEWMSNYQGKIFDTAGLPALKDSVGTLGQYDVATALGVATQAQAARASLNTIYIVTSAQCGTAGATVAASPRQIAIQYALETSAGTTSGNAVCLEM
jgi:prepilin-type N-terminal cleavage/methylation domain-containing protein